MPKVEADLNVHESSDQLSMAYIHRVPRSIYDDDEDRYNDEEGGGVAIEEHLMRRDNMYFS